MNCFAHIFIGKEFEQLGQDIGRATYKHGSSAVSYLNYYLLDMEQSEPVLSKLNTTSSAPSSELSGMDRYARVQWESCNVKGADLSTIYRLNIFNDILGGVNRGTHNCLYVCIHFPFYKGVAFKHLSSLYSSIRSARMPDKISFIGYCSDLAGMISLQENDVEKLPPKLQIASYKQFKEKNDVLINQHLLLFQNAFQNGMPLNLTRDSLVDTLSLLLLQYVEHYDAFYPDTISYSDMMSFGISAISLDKYIFVDYLFCQTMRHAMDVSSVMDDEVSVNEVFAKVRDILHTKDRVLSDFLAKYEHEHEWNIVEAENSIKQEAEAIVERCEEVLHHDKSMPIRAAILAALLQTKCDLFHQMVYDPESLDLSDLFVEPIDYFIDHDKSHFYWSDEDTPPVNPIKELKILNNQLINSESQIRDMQKALNAYQAELENQKSAEKISAFGDDGYFHVDDRRYKLLPNTYEDPLQETYQPHEVHAGSLDLRNYFREIQDQGSQGSCLAFALTSVFEFVMRSNNRREEYDLSEAFLYYNARKLDPDNSENEDSGSRFNPAIDSLYQYGIAKEALCRYDENTYDRKPSDEAYDDANKRLLRKALNVPHSVDAIKSALEDGYPVVASFTLCSSFSNLSRGFVPMPTIEEIEKAKVNEGSEQCKHTNHAMVIVGFDDKIQNFLVRNSWGLRWGDQGYCYIPYSYVENENLFNFACILTEIESIYTQKASFKEIPILRLDDSDTTIRYHLTMAALQREIRTAESIREKRIALQQTLEHLKQLFSNHNDCEIYINRTCEKTAEEQETLRAKIKEEQKEIDKEYDEYQNVKKRLIVKTAGISFSIWLFVGLYNWILHKITDAYSWTQGVIDGIKETVMFVRGLFAGKPIKSLEIDLYIDWIHYVVILGIIGICFYRGHRAWKIWRESKNEHERQIYLCNKEIVHKQKEIDGFRFKTQVARKWLSALTDSQTVIQQRYTNIISRINNLRAWYVDVSDMEHEINLQSAVPYTTLLDKQILDKFFENNIQNDPNYEIDFMEDLEKPQNTEESMVAYKAMICDKIVTQLMRNPRLNAFHIAEHIISESFSDIARKVVSKGGDNGISMENVKRQSEIFMHINPLQRGVIMPSTYVLAPFFQQYDHRLRQKVGHNFDTYLQSTATNRLVMLQIMCLQFDECTMFQ